MMREAHDAGGPQCKKLIMEENLIGLYLTVENPEMCGNMCRADAVSRSFLDQTGKQ